MLFAGLAVAHGLGWDVMKNPRLVPCVLASVIVSAACAPHASAQLPALQDKQWLGYFAGFATKRFQFGVTTEGKFQMPPLDNKGEPLSERIRPKLNIFVQEIMPDGKAVWKQIKPETLESPQSPTDKLDKILIRGKVTGDAAFEVNIEQQRGIAMVGGRITDPGTLKNPLRFSMRVTIPNIYPEDDTSDKQKAKVFEKKIKDDRIDVKWTDGKRKKEGFDKPVDAGSKDLNGPGIAAMEMSAFAYKDRKILFTAAPNSVIRLSNDGKTAPLYQGFTFTWEPDPEKDKDGKARLSIEVK